MAHSILSTICADNVRSDVEYLFESMAEPERSALPGAEVQDPIACHRTEVPALTVLGQPQTDLIDADISLDEMDAGWELLLVLQTIGATFHAMLTEDEPWMAERAARDWITRTLHSGKDAVYIQTVCEHLQGVLDALALASTGSPARWWPGKRGTLSDPRVKELGAWYIACSHGATPRQWRVRKVSELTVQAVSLKSGYRQILHREEARARFTLLGKMK